MDILQKAFSAELIKAATSDDEFEKIEAAVTKVSLLLASRPTEYLTAVYLASGSGETESALLSDVYALIKKEWRTVVTRYPGFPTQMVRAILLCAVVELADKKDDFAAAFGLLLPNVQPHLDGRDDVIAIWKDLAEQFQRSYENKAETRWGVPALIELPELELSADASRKIETSRKGLNAQALAGAILPAFTGSNNEGEGLEGGNPHAPQQVAAWGTHAANKLATVLAGSVSQGLVTNITSPDSEALASELSEHLRIVVGKLLSAVEGQDLRTRLLWWKESGYSPSGHAAYNKFAPSERVLRSVADLSSWLPRHTPPSAFHFIREALDFGHDTEVTIADLASDKTREVLSDPNPKGKTEWEGRSLLQILDASEAVDADSFALKEDRMRDPRDFVEHLLRETLALRILADVKPSKKPRT